MSKEFKLPDLGESIVSAQVVKVLIKPGDFVKEDQTVLEIETDKATIEVPSEISGKVTGVYIKEGDKVPVGAVVFSVEGGGETSMEITSENVTAEVGADNKAETTTEPTEPTEKPSEPQTEKSGTVEVVLPDLGDGISQAMVVKVTVKVGDTIKEDDTVLEIETDKATVEVPSTASGVVTEVFAKENEKLPVGGVILVVSGEKVEVSASLPVTGSPLPEAKVEKPASVAHKVGAPPAFPVPKSAPTVKLSEAELAELKEDLTNPEVAIAPPKVFLDMQPPITANAAPAAPSVRRLAREIGVDINKVPGSGPRGRISMDDVKAYSKALHEGRTSGVVSGERLVVSGGIAQKPLPDFSKFGDIERKEMNNIRAKTAEHLSYAWATIPHVTQFDKADITELEELRKKFAPMVAKGGGKLTMTSILVKVITAALKQFPQFNSSVDMDKKEIIYKNYFNIGIAVDTEHGLIVPNIKGTDRMNLTQISAEMAVLSEKARAKKIGLDDIQGGCFTISNLGGIGGTYFTPVVNSPEVAILGVSRGSMEPVYVNVNFVPRLMLPLSLSYDHRVIDGADAIRFLRWVIEALENPFKLLIEG
ncbi:MAG: acetyltransferase component of pyruvate dehydrogenase complex [Ignavibacteriaceae bacterium]|nr:MAG: acetyltransferase component of pyruvate dehydrogenase complex [Ignavibacteriaceae bacterium]